MTTRNKLAATYAALTRSRPVDDPELLRVKSALELERINAVLDARLDSLTPTDRAIVANRVQP